MATLVIAEHDNATVKGATLNTVTAAHQAGGDVHVRYTTLEQLDDITTARATVIVGIALGVLVSISSVGAGAVGVGQAEFAVLGQQFASHETAIYPSRAAPPAPDRCDAGVGNARIAQSALP